MEAPSRTANVRLSSAAKRYVSTACFRLCTASRFQGPTWRSILANVFVTRRNTLIPLKTGTPQQFQLVRSVLEQSHYTEEAICKRLNLESIFDFRSTLEAESKPRPTDDALDFLIMLLMDGESVSESRLSELL